MVGGGTAAAEEEAWEASTTYLHQWVLEETWQRDVEEEGVVAMVGDGTAA